MLGGTLALDTDGQLLDLTGDAPVSALRARLDVLAGLLGVAVPATGDTRWRERARPPEPEPIVLGDAAWRRQRLAGQPAPPEWTLAQLVGPEAVTVVVADEDPAAVGAMVRAALGPAGFEVGVAAPPVASPVPTTSIVAVSRDTAGDDHLTLHRAHPTVPADDPRWYLTTGLLGGYYDARLMRRIARRGGGYHAFCGRDRFLGASRSYVRVVVGHDLLGTAVEDVMTEIGTLATHPPGPAEIATARRYCRRLAEVAGADVVAGVRTCSPPARTRRSSSAAPGSRTWRQRSGADHPRR